MTVSTNVNRWSYTGDAVTASFAYTAPIFDDGDLTVTVDGTTQVLGTAYTVTGAGGASGAVVFEAAYIPAASAAIEIVRTVPYEQPSALPEGGDFPTATVEEMADRAVVLAAQARDLALRSLRQPDEDGAANYIGALPAAADRASKFAAYDADGDPIASAGTTGTVPVSSVMEPVIAAATLADARTELGATAVGEALFTAASAAAARAAIDAAALTVANVFTKTQSWKYGADVASAGALTLGDGNIFNITGTTTITSIGTKGAGTVVILRFAGALTFTHHATDLYLNDAGLNITTKAGDHAVLVEYATGDWRLVSYHAVDGRPILAYDSGVQAITNGGNLNLSHLLGVKPTRVQLFLRCKTAEHNWSIGDEIMWAAGNEGGFGSYGLTVSTTTTQINIIFPSTVAAGTLIDKTAHTQVTLTPNNWEVIVRAYP